jgi:hypothetical protein
MIVTSLVLSVLIQGGAVASANDELYLACKGGATAQVATGTSSASAIDSRGGSAAASGITTETQYIEGIVLFRMAKGLAEVNVPRQFLSGQKLGNAGWFKVKKTLVSEDEITGKIQTEFLTTSSFRIDRRTGIMTSDGGFSGNCTLVDVMTKKF